MPQRHDVAIAQDSQDLRPIVRDRKRAEQVSRKQLGRIAQCPLPTEGDHFGGHDFVQSGILFSQQQRFAVDYSEKLVPLIHHIDVAGLYLSLRSLGEHGSDLSDCLLRWELEEARSREMDGLLVLLLEDRREL